MPTYDIQNKKTGEVKELFCSISEKEEAIKKEGPDWEYCFATPRFSTIGTKSISRTGQAGSNWNDLLGRIKKGSGKHNTINVDN